MGGDLSRNLAASKDTQNYFKSLKEKIEECYNVAEEARKKGLDPEKEIEIPQATDLASRVEELVGPPGIAPKIKDATKKIGDRELVSLKIAKEIVGGEEYDFKSVDEAVDQAIRTGLAILTEGVLVAPLEGIADVKLGKNKDGSNYIDLYFSGPIRSAGGTGQAMSVLIADVVRRELDIGKYEPTKGEIERYKEEIPAYKRAQHLQYTPTADEIHEIVSNCPVCINGEGSEKEEVTGYRDLPRVETNRLRGGACLVIAEGLCLKAPKLLKHVKKLKLKGWRFLDVFVNKNKKKEEEDKKENRIPSILPSKKYIGEVIAGRPVFSHPSRKGGFRLRYGRSRTAGLASTAINPASMSILDDFIAVGTQIKTERPGKATIGTPCITIEGPIVLMQNGDLVQFNRMEKIDKQSIKKIIDLGEILVPFGEFAENNKRLPDASYTYEWWIQDLQKKLNILPKNMDIESIQKADEKTEKKIKEDFDKKIDLREPSPKEAFEISKRYDVPLHPYYNLFWHDITIEDLKLLSDFVKKQGKINEEKMILPFDKGIKDIIIKLGCLHRQKKDELIIERYSQPLLRCIGLKKDKQDIVETERYKLFNSGLDEKEPVLEVVSKLSDFKVKARAPSRIGTRMARPEKASARQMQPPPHVLFPLGDAGGNQRLVNKAIDKGRIEVEIGTRTCPECGKKTYKYVCQCGSHTEITDKNRVELLELNLAKEVKEAQKNVKERVLPETIKGVIGTLSKHKTPESLEKGILRAKYGLSVFKDGTVRFDMTDASLTHFRPKEIGVSVEKLKKLGYTKDIFGKQLKKQDQLCELKAQDVIISKSCAEYFLKVTKFIDDLLVKFYNLKRFYNIKKLEDLTGHLVAGLAPHTSAGALGRIIGFTKAQVCFAHPYYHAAKRRNCFNFNHRVFLYDAKQDKFITEKIGKLVENNLAERKPKVIDSYGTVKIDVPSSEQIYSYAINPDTGKLVKKKLKCFIKGKTDQWINIKTSTNRELKVTPDHPLVCIKDNKLHIKKAADIKEGDKIPLATKNPDETIITKINLAEKLSEIDNEISSNIKIRNADLFFKNLVSKISWKKIVDTCDIKGSLRNTKHKWTESVPLTHFKKICKTTDINFSDLPNHARLGFRRDHINLPAYIEDIDNLFWLLGVYIAEGWSRTNNSSYHVSFRACDKNIFNEIKSKMKKIFGLKPYLRESKITYSSRLLHLIFTKIWKTGSSAYKKRVPEIIYHGDESSINQFISGYFDGDGSVSLKPDRITFYSVSEELLEGISNLLLRSNILSRYQRIKKRDPGKTVLERYLKLGKKPVFHNLYHLVLTGEDKYRFAEYVNPVSEKKNIRSKNMSYSKPKNASRLICYKGKRYPAVSFSDYTFDIVKAVKNENVDNEPTYCLDIEGNSLDEKAVLWHNQLLQIRCDGDEDALMLLMDALLNFSHAYIPDKRGGKMDLPLILTTRIDPAEVDKEAHNVDTLARYPLDFYEATLRHEHPKDWEKKMGLVAERIGSKLQFEKFGFTHDTNDISEGPKVSRYKSLKSMTDKMDAQLRLAALIRAVDTPDVAYKVIQRHFLPDILGNFRAFSKQSVRCAKCNINYRRMPLKGVCEKCGGKLTLTVHEKSVRKYLDISKEVAARYNIPAYANQRINLVEKSINSLFESDKVRTTKLDEFL